MKKHLLHHLLPALLLHLLLILPVSRCWSQNAPVPDTGIEIIAPPVPDDEYEEEEETEDTGSIVAAIVPYSRTVPADTIAAFKKNASFAYMGYLDSLLRVGEKARRNQPPPKEEIVEEGPSFWDLGVVKLIFYGVAIGLVGFVIYKLFVGQGLFFKNRKIRTDIPEIEIDETATESDLEKALRTAVARKDYRLGVRYLFLMSLQRLGERGVLQLSTEKTNYQYATELAGKPYANRFAQLSLQYEYVWFGNFQLSETQFSTIQQQHQQFVKEI